jgi:hypothetical protein
MDARERAAQAPQNIAEQPRTASSDKPAEDAQVVNDKSPYATGVNSSMGADGFEPS